MGLLLILAAVLHGTVRERTSGEPVPFALIEVADLGRMVTADAHGRFVLDGVPAGRWLVRISALGHQSDSIAIDVSAKDTAIHVRVELETAPIGLPALVVRDSVRPHHGVIRVPAATLSAIPRVLDADVLRPLTSLPGVRTASDFSTALYVRGATPDMTDINLDGMLLLSPYHLGGVFAAIDPTVVSTVEVVEGAIGVGERDKLGGIVNVWTREGSKDRHHTSGALGVTSARASLEGPLGNGSYLASIRHTYIGEFISALNRLGVTRQSFPYGFVDGYAKYSYGGAGTAVTVSVYSDDEAFSTPTSWDGASLEAGWGSLAGSARVQARLGAFDAALSLTATRFSGDWAYHASDVGDTDSAYAHVRQVILRSAFVLVRQMRHVGLQVGADAAHEGGRASSLGRGDDLQLIIPPIDAKSANNVFAVFAEGTGQQGRATVVPGARLSCAFGGCAVLPRIRASYAVTNRWKIDLSGGWHRQLSGTLRDEESVYSRVFAYDINLPIRDRRDVLRSREFSVGASGSAGVMGIDISLYRTWYDALALPPLPTNPLRSPVLVIERQSGSGTSSGFDAHTGANLGRLALNLGYSWARHRRNIDGIGYRPSYDRAHRGVVQAAFNGARSSVTTAFVFETGAPYTSGVSQLHTYRYSGPNGDFVPDRTSVLLGNHNAARLPSYTRFDLSLRRNYSPHWFGRNMSVAPYLDIHNVTNSKNVLWGTPQINDGRPRLEYAPQLPLLPTIGVEWRF